MAGRQAAGSRLQKIYETIAAGANSASYIYDPDLQNHVTLYKSLLNSGKRIVIVSHSQGNFYANAAYNQLIPANAAWSANIGNVQVATPASYVASGGPYTTVPEDAAMALIPGKLPPSDPVSAQSYNLLPYSLTVSPNFVNLGYAAWLNASRGHSFVNWYLAWSYTRDRIMNHIVTTIGKLQYPKKCIQWPPVQTPTSWQKVLTHDWNTYVTNWTQRVYTRRIRDDINGWMFYANFNYLGTGMVNIRIKAFDDSVNASLTPYHYSKYITLSSNYPFSNKFLGFAPVPGGVGLLFLTSTSIQNHGLGDNSALTGNSSIVLISHVWDQVAGGFATAVSKLSLPGYAFSAWTTSHIRPPYQYYTDLNSSLYVSTLQRPLIQYDTYKSWVLLAGTHDPAGNPPKAPWAVVSVNNGALNVANGEIITTTIADYNTVHNISVPTGAYSSILTLLPLPLAYEYSFHPAVGICLSCYSIKLQPSPTVPNTYNTRIIDQRIVGGSDLYIPGQGIQSAPGYYDNRVFAAFDAGTGGVYNQAGQRHPTLGANAIPSAAVATTFKDLLFFQW